MRVKDIAGKEYGRLVVESFAGTDDRGRASWFVRCKCGRTKVSKAADLIRGAVRSCGCLGDEQRRAAGEKSRSQLSKSSNPTEYNAWEGMIRRCYKPGHPSYERYGGRGITVCDEWRAGFPHFLRDMGKCPPGHTVERDDNSGNYTPDNCRWASKKEQANNRRSNVLITHDGKTMNIGQWAEFRGWAYSTIANRLANGWSPEKAVSVQPKKRGHP